MAFERVNNGSGLRIPDLDRRISRYRSVISSLSRQ